MSKCCQGRQSSVLVTLVVSSLIIRIFPVFIPPLSFYQFDVSWLDWSMSEFCMNECGPLIEIILYKGGPSTTYFWMMDIVCSPGCPKFDDIIDIVDLVSFNVWLVLDIGHLHRLVWFLPYQIMVTQIIDAWNV